MPDSIASLRQNYDRHHLNEQDVATNPLEQFARWFEEAVAANYYEPNAMTLATVSADGRPSARVVLLKGVDHGGFVFYTNYNSRKGQDLAANAWAALTFWWDTLERQVRIEGQVEKVSPAESEAYFLSRPRESRLGAWVSNQSDVIDSREQLTARLATVQAEYADKEVPRPPYWGGYRLQPAWVEFWQGRPGRLHDRLAYERQDDGGWHLSRLSP